MKNYLGRDVIKKVNIKVEGTFSSHYEAEKQLREMGYNIGSMWG